MAADRSYSHISDPADLEGNAQGTLSLSTTGAQTAQLVLGVYDVWADADCYLKVANGTASDVTTSTGYKLIKDNVIPIIIRKDRRIGGIVATGTATLSYHKVD